MAKDLFDLSFKEEASFKEEGLFLLKLRSLGLPEQHRCDYLFKFAKDDKRKIFADIIKKNGVPIFENTRFIGGTFEQRQDRSLRLRIRRKMIELAL